MGTITSIMDIAQQALMADQDALNVTANNVANQNTPGYTREVVNFQSVDAVTLSGLSVGSGVTVNATSQRDRVLEQRVQQQTQVEAQSGALESALQQIQNIFGLSSTSSSASATALGTATTSFFSALTALSSDPADTATRQNVLSAANALAGAFNSSANQLAQVSSSLNQQVVGDVSQVNSLTTTIASLNAQITSISPNGDAGTLEDQRQSAIAQLSQLVGLDQISTENNGITLTTSNGAVLVSGSKSFALSTTQVGGTTHILAGLSNPNVDGGQVAAQFLASFFGQIGSDTSAASTSNSADQATLTQLTTQRDSLSGVSLDEEASNLTQYQRAYQAAAQVFNIANTVMASALNLGVETSVT